MYKRQLQSVFCLVVHVVVVTRVIREGNASNVLSYRKFVAVRQSAREAPCSTDMTRANTGEGVSLLKYILKLSKLFIDLSIRKYVLKMFKYNQGNGLIRKYQVK